MTHALINSPNIPSTIVAKEIQNFQPGTSHSYAYIFKQLLAFSARNATSDTSQNVVQLQIQKPSSQFLDTAGKDERKVRSDYKVCRLFVLLSRVEIKGDIIQNRPIQT